MKSSVSVIIPAHNAREFIGDAVKSAIAESPGEIIVVDDGSRDMDYRELELLDPRVCVIVQPNRGVSAARNAACEKAEGEWLAFLDADDIWLSGKLDAQMAYLGAHPSYEGVFAGSWKWWPGKPLTQCIGPQERIAKTVGYADFLTALPVGPSTLVIRKRAWRAVQGFDESVRYGEDIRFYLALASRYELAVLGPPSVLYRQHESSATRTLQRDNHWALALESALAAFGYLDAPRDLVLAHIARLHRLHGHAHFWGGSVDVALQEFHRARQSGDHTFRLLAYLLMSFARSWALSMRRRIAQLTPASGITEAPKKP